MKTEKTVRKSENSKKSAKTKKTEKKSVSKKMPGEEEIRIKAEEIYRQRLATGETGSPESDWLKAEEFLKNS